MIAVDIGNTRAKFGYFSCQPLQSRFPTPMSCIRILHGKNKYQNNGNLFDARKLNLIADWLQNKQNCNNWNIAITAANCNPDSLIDNFISLAPNSNFNVLTNDNIPINSNVNSPTKIGIDRLLDALAATKFIENKSLPRIIETIIVIDAGTAITIDVVKINYNSTSTSTSNYATFEGGAILAGLKTLSVTLNHAINKLPEINIADFNSIENLTYPAKNTESAIVIGIVGSLISTINFFVKKVETTNSNESNNQQIPIIFTGGDAQIIANLYAREFPNSCLSIAPDLTLAGIAITVFQQQ
ncbi:MAG: type III pantothenate kinase [Planctomycetaceae bacterium]|jgi:pantothenate kinase type III|nr:type III pantothenate kinase [Planctomycetaceae bacterium]